jgi:hypothetical protein
MRRNKARGSDGAPPSPEPLPARAMQVDAGEQS